MNSNTAAGPSNASYAGQALRFVGRSGKQALRRSGLWSAAQPGIPIIESDTSTPSSLDTTAVLYPTLTTHPEPLSHPIIVLSLAQIQNIPSDVRDDELLDLLLAKLEPWVGEEGVGGYVLVVLASSGEGRGWPGMSWWIWNWRRIPRRCRKNLKRLYIIHPSSFTRRLLPLMLPFLSPKSYNKLYPLQSLLSLNSTYCVSLSGIEVTLPVIEEESKYLVEHPYLRVTTGHAKSYGASRVSSWTDSVTSSLSSAASYISLSGTSSLGASHNRWYWGRSSKEVVSACGGRVPPVLEELRKVILGECTATEGVFRRSSNSHLIPALTALLDLPIPAQPTLPWVEIARDDPLLPPKLFLRFFAELSEPIIPIALYPHIRRSVDTASLQTEFISSLSSVQHSLLDYLIHLLHHLSRYEAQTKMAPLALAIVVAPVLIRGSDTFEDAELCLLPGKTLPPAMYAASGREPNRAQGQGSLVGLLLDWISDWNEVEGRAGGEKGRCGCDWEIVL